VKKSEINKHIKKCVQMETKKIQKREKNKRMVTDTGRKAERKKRIHVRVFSPVRKRKSRSNFLRNISIYVPICTASHARRA